MVLQSSIQQAPDQAEDIIEPDLPIIDAHHHLWYLPEDALHVVENDTTIVSQRLAPTYRRHSRYLFDEFHSDITSGHAIRASVFVDAATMYRRTGPEIFKSTGEVEFVNGVAAMSASGLFGDHGLCAGIVGSVNLAAGDAVEAVLLAHLRAGGDRYRGVRSFVMYDEDPTILGAGGIPHLLLDKQFRAGFRLLAQFGLSFDALVLEPQLPELIDLARAFPETMIILNHLGVPLGVGRYIGRREERFHTWRSQIIELSKCNNVTVKLGGIGLPFSGLSNPTRNEQSISEALAETWRPYVLACVEAFGVSRCMFESNYPVDAAACTYTALWNVFKIISREATQQEKAELFYRTAKRVYRLGHHEVD